MEASRCPTPNAARSYPGLTDVPASTAGPIAIRNLSSRILQQAVIAPTSTLDLSQDVFIDGSVTLELIYLEIPVMANSLTAALHIQRPPGTEAGDDRTQAMTPKIQPHKPLNGTYRQPNKLPMYLDVVDYDVVGLTEQLGRHPIGSPRVRIGTDALETLGEIPGPSDQCGEWAMPLSRA